jgi:hypothetical protein
VSESETAAITPLEDLNFYGEVHEYGPGSTYVSVPLPNVYGMPRHDLRGTPPVSRGVYANVGFGPAEKYFGHRDGQEPPFWSAAPHVAVDLWRGTGVSLHARTGKDADTGSEEYHARWPVDDDAYEWRADRLRIPPEWLRPLAEAMLKMAEHLETSAAQPRTSEEA